MAATRIAVVDDDRAIRELLEALLSEEGYAVTSLSPGANLIAELVAARPATVILDWRMEGMEGSALDTIRADRRLRTLPILICTGDLEGMRSEAPRLATQPNVVIVEKPFQIDVLLSVLERLAVTPSDQATSSSPATLSEELRAAVERRGPAKQARAVIEVFRRTGSWACAELWLSERGLLRCVAAVADERRRGFVEHSQSISLVPGFGLPGRVWISRRPTWIPSVEQDRNFPRATAARRFGVRSAVGVPVLLGRSVVGVIGLYGGEPKAPDEAVLARLADLASGLGPWVDAARGELLRPDPLSAASRRLAHEAAQLADVAAVDLIGDEGDLRRVAVAHRDPAMVEVAMRLEGFSPAPEGPVARAVATREIQRLAVSDATLRRWSGSPEHLLVLRALLLNSLLAVPLIHGDRVIGGVTLSSADPHWHASEAALDAAAALSAPGASEQIGRLLAGRRGSRTN